ncbi:MAG: hypothetical protein Q8M29_04235 [Bacteroidota bacterium]|nr:hypothetical protein [Bacteroidota bacterium]
MKKNITTVVCMAVLFFACKDRDDFMSYSDEKVIKKYFMRGDGDWNIDEMKVWVIDESNNGNVLAEVTRTNIGHVKFKSTDKMDWVYTKDTVDVQYATLPSLTDCYWSYLGGHFEWNEHNLGNTVTIDKKNMVLFFPAHLNLYSTSKLIFGKGMEFQFKLSKK